MCRTLVMAFGTFSSWIYLGVPVILIRAEAV